MHNSADFCPMKYPILTLKHKGGYSYAPRGFLYSKGGGCVMCRYVLCNVYKWCNNNMKQSSKTMKISLIIKPRFGVSYSIIDQQTWPETKLLWEYRTPSVHAHFPFLLVAPEFLYARYVWSYGKKFKEIQNGNSSVRVFHKIVFTKRIILMNFTFFYCFAFNFQNKCE